MREVNFEFYVLNYDFNRKRVENFNLFNNIHVYEEALKETKRHLRNKKAYPYKDYVERLRQIIAWKEWARREYEISVGDAFETDVRKLEKWDCYKQAEPNMEVVADMCIKKYKEYRKEKEKGEA